MELRRKYAHDSQFSFSTGKVGDLAGFTSAIVLAMIVLFQCCLMTPHVAVA